MSSSSTSEAWSDSETESNKQEATSLEPQTQAYGSMSRPRHGEKLSFQAPKGYTPSPFSPDVLSIFSHDAFKDDRKKQLWTIKIPDNMSPSALDGLVIDLPSVSTSTLAQVQIQTPVMGSATQTQTRSYSLRSRRGGHRKPAVEGGGSVTQLIAMAGGQVASDADVEELGNQEGESLHVMLPLSHAKPGRFVFAPNPIREHLQLVLDAPAREDFTANESTRRRAALQANLGAGSGAGAHTILQGHKRKREQPWEKLKGFFTPAGSRAREEVVEPVHVRSPTKRAKKQKEGSNGKEGEQRTKEGKKVKTKDKTKDKT